MQKHTSRHAGWKYTVSALAVSVAMAPVAQAASVLQGTGRLELTGSATRAASPVTRTAIDTGPVNSVELVVTKTKELAGQEYTFQKWMDSKGNTTSVILDDMGNAVLESALPEITQNILGPQLEALLRTRSGRRGLHKVTVALELGLQLPTERMQTGKLEMNENGETQLQINGRTVSERDLARLQAAEQKAHQAQAVERFAERNAFVEAFARRHNLDLAQDALQSSGSVLTFELDAVQIEDLARFGGSTVRGIELYQEMTPDGELPAARAANMVASGVDPWAFDNPLTLGNDVGVYFTDGGCPDEDDIDGSYTRLSGTFQQHGKDVGDIIREVSPESAMYCRAGWVPPTQDDLTTLSPPIEVVTRSGSLKGQLSYGIWDRTADDFVYDELIPWFNSAGNEGVKDPMGSGVFGLVGGGGQALNVITVGNYIEATDTVDVDSSWFDPSTGNNKPEIVGPGTATSWTTPHAAAFAVDVMSQSTWFTRKPALMKALMLAGATDPIIGDCVPTFFPAVPCTPAPITEDTIPDKTGVGGINFHSANYSATKFYYEGANDDFDALDQEDGAADGYITDEVFVYDSYDRVRVAMSWLTRGTYTFDHKDDAHAVGIDLDLRVYDPAGDLMGRSWSYDNTFEVVEFEPTTSGTYTFKIDRYSNNDTSNKIQIGVVVSKIND